MDLNLFSFDLERSEDRKHDENNESAQNEALERAIARHQSARMEIGAYRGVNDDLFSYLIEQETAALTQIIDAPCAQDADFLVKLRYLAEYEASKTLYQPPQLWRVNGPLLLAIWRRFGWSAENKPRHA